jgi:hypothetical protein
MEDPVTSDWLELIDAVRIWSSWGESSWPNRDDSRLRWKLGITKAERLLPAIKRLHADFYLSDANFKAGDLAEMAKLAKEHFQTLHPDVPEEIANIFSWCYTFDWR